MEPARDDMIPTGAHPVARWCRATPRAIAVIDNEVSYSYSALAANIVQTATILTAAGLRRGMIVGIDCNVQYLHLVLILACEIVGATHVCLMETDLTPDGDLVAHCDFLCTETQNDRVAEFPRVLRLSLEFVETMLSVAVQDDHLEMLERTHPAADIVRIGRTSGTTGRPKFVGCSRRSLKNIVDILPYMLKFDDTRQNFVSMYPFSQMGTYTDSLLALYSGATVIYGVGEALAANARKLPACHTFLIIRDAVNFSKSKQIGDGRLDTLSIRLIGGFVPPALRAALRQAVTTDIRAAYSMNETSFVTTSDDDGPGRLLPDVSVRIVDDAGRDLGLGESGTILVRTSRMADLYLWDAAETARHFVDGWYRTSDVGYMPEPGRLFVLGRADEMLNLGGIKIAPHPIEEQIRAFGGVSDAVLLGLDDALGTGVLHVVIERDDAAQDHMMQARVVHLLVGHVTSFKLYCVDRLPRTQMGKVQRNLVKQSLEDGTVAFSRIDHRHPRRHGRA
jgi:acyl-coenzyme A synthetase/AMP-(fatty) acid ligase